MAFDIIVGRNESDKKKFGTKGTILLGRAYVKMGQTTSLSNHVYLDVIKAHVVFVVGKRGGGKCLLGDSLITLEDGTQAKIQDLEKNNQNIFALNSQLKIKEQIKENFFKRKVEKILSLKLRSGREIKLTPEHPLLTIKGWIPAEKLSIKSRIAVPRKIESFGKETIAEHQVKILAYLISEGHTMDSWVLFSNSDPILVTDFKKAISKFNPELQVNQHSKPGCYRVTNKDNKYSFKKNPLKSWLIEQQAFEKYAKEKDIPQIIFKLPKEQLSLFLNRLFSCDGSIYYDKSIDAWEICYASSSKSLIHQVQHLLLRFGIIGKLRSKQTKYNEKIFPSFELVLNRENCILFLEQIGFLGEKDQKAKQCLPQLKNKKGNPNIDTIPKEAWDLFRPQNGAAIGKALGYKYPKAMRERIRYSTSRNLMLQIAEAEQNEALKLLATSDIFWDEIQSISLEEGEFWVYDITVPQSHNFIANDIIVHNSYSASVIAEGIVDLPEEIAKNLAVIMLDTMGVFWTMKYPNEKDAELLEMWGLKPKGLDKIKIFTPYGKFEDAKTKGVPTDYPFSIKASELSGEDWRLAFELSASHPVSILIEKLLGDFAEEKVEDFTIDMMIAAFEKETSFPVDVRNEAINRFRAAKRWGLFSDKGTKIDVLIKGGTVSILDMSAYATSEGGWGVKALVVGLICKKVFIERMISRQIEEIEAIRVGYSYFKLEEENEDEEKKPLVWFLLDEAHELLPFDGKTAATDALVTILREGRQPGLSLLLITQQPGKIHTDVLTQSDIVLAHRLTAKRDVDALNSMMQSYLGDTLTGYLNVLPAEPGAAILLDDNSERLFPIRTRPKLSWHGGEAPTAIKYKKSENLGI